MEEMEEIVAQTREWVFKKLFIIHGEKNGKKKMFTEEEFYLFILKFIDFIENAKDL